MKSTHLPPLLALLTLLPLSSPAQEAAPRIEGHITEVTLYREAALVTRKADLRNTTESDLLGGRVNVFLDGQVTDRSVELTCEIVVDNTKQQAVNVRIRERTPHTEDATSLRVSVGETSHKLSTDPDYQRFEKSKGVLLWNLPVEPGTGEKATTLRYSYSLEFDKNMTLQDISGEQKTRLRTEFIESSKASIRK